MTQPSTQPKLTPHFCFDETALRDFLRLSRSTIDDSIVQNLNNLETPASKGFDPSSIAERQLQAPPPPWRHRIDLRACQNFKDRVLFPSWQTRSDVLNYCAGVATSPDPDDPESTLRQVESARARERVVDERLDPYSARYFAKEARTEKLANLIRNERSVEKIIRSRTWALVGERCGNERVDFEEALDKWRRQQEEPL